MTHPYLIFTNTNYTVEQSREQLIPGYLILRPTPATDSMSTMTKAALNQFGSMLALSYACVEHIINPEIIYCARFGEKVRAIHFHIFPRSKYIGDAYRKAHSLNENADISGPRLLDWIMNNKIQFEISKQVDVSIQLLKNKFLELKNLYL
jgi:diadenosine tetraphosphate (Ap4A) HIT family hydrolase